MNNATAILETTLRKGSGHFTLNEAAVITGFPTDTIRDALDALMQKYVCRLQVTENGDLIYDFGEKARRRGQKSFAEIMSGIGDWLWKIFTIIFKIWIAVTLVVYFILFVIILIAMLFSKSSNSDSGDNIFGSLFDAFFSIFRWTPHTGNIFYEKDRGGYRYKKYKPEPSVLNEKKKGFIASVYDFVFGPARVNIDPLNNEKEVAAYLTEQKGIIVTSELEGLAGWTFSQAQTFFTDCLVRFQGEVKVSDNGVMYGEFDRIPRGIGKAELGKIIWYWDEYEPEYELTGNTAGRNFVILFMNAFNLIFSLYMLDNFRQTGTSGPEQIFLGWIPLIFSALFFLVPLMRLPKVLIARRKRQVSNIRKRIFKVIYQHNGEAIGVDKVTEAVNSNAIEEALPKETIESVMRELSLDLAGETIISEQSGEMLYAFPKISYELETVKILREQKHIEMGLGDIIADSGE